MKQLVLALVAVIGLGVGSVFAQSYSHSAPPTDHHAASGNS
jgi:hypothetical protein